uniref:Leucine rich immune protein (Coil-less) n=1 Tax=Anopheles atroparvus TaxID=41427 RepID=A0A182JA56_ANOAO
MFSTPVEVFRFCCVEKHRKCTLQNWSPKEEGFYVLSHIPTDGNYTLQLRTLLLRDNQLESLNLNLFAPFPNLTELNVSLNKLRHVAGHFSNASLASLLFAHNRVKRLSLCEWDVLQEVTELSVAFNNLTRIPECLWMLPNVSSLYLQGNQIAVFDEHQFYGMTNLEVINLAFNKLSSVTIDPAKLPASLLQLHLYRNCLCSLNVSDQQLRAMGNLMIYLNKMSANRFINEESDCHRC